MCFHYYQLISIYTCTIAYTIPIASLETNNLIADSTRHNYCAVFDNIKAATSYYKFCTV